jgi:hypothetical protein
MQRQTKKTFAPKQSSKGTDETITSEIDKLLSQIYYNPARVGSLGGVEALRKEGNKALAKSGKPGLKKRTVETWLSTQTPYYMHKQVRKRRFQRNPLRVGGVGDLMQSDIVYYKDIPKYKYNYLLLVQDTASRYIFYRFMRTKTCKETLKKIKEIFQQTKLKRIFNLMTDFDGAYYCKEMKNYLGSIDCNHYSKKSGEFKTPTLDRYIRVLNEKLYRYFDRFETRNWVKGVKLIISAMNRSHNRIMKMTPVEAWKTLPRKKYVPTSSTGQKTVLAGKFKVGDEVVMLGLPPTGLEHAYKGKWTQRRYIIDRIKVGDPRNLYYLIDAKSGDPIDGSFYQDELQHARSLDPRQTTSSKWLSEKRIDRVMKTKVVKGEKMLLVRYKLMGTKDDEWIKEKDLVDIKPQRIKRRKKN